MALITLDEAVLCRDKCDRAREVHRAFLKAYGRTAQQVPLVRYTGSGGRRSFSDIS